MLNSVSHVQPFAFLDPITGRATPRAGIAIVSGDLTQILRDDPVDALVVSAFKNDYSETHASLIGALARCGLKVGELSDGRLETFDEARCWISSGLPPERAAEFGFRQLICVERDHDGALEASVNALGLALAATAHARHISSIAMPLLATGDQSIAVSTVVPLLLSTLTRQMRQGSPLKRAIIAVYDRSMIPAVTECVAQFQEGYKAQEAEARIEGHHDLFISYSHEDYAQTSVFTDEIRRVRPHTTIYQDLHQLTPGTAFNHELLAKIDHVNVFVPFFSKHYFASQMCGEELASAHITHKTDRMSRPENTL